MQWLKSTITETKYIVVVWTCTENGRKQNSLKILKFDFGNNEAES
jgi:hypothetical protein